MYLFGVFLLLVGTHVCFIDANFGSGEGNDYTYGTQATTDTLIASETITKSKSLLGITTKTYTLTQAGTAKTITYIKITDLKKMRGATAEITSGGSGIHESHDQIHLCTGSWYQVPSGDIRILSAFDPLIRFSILFNYERIVFISH